MRQMLVKKSSTNEMQLEDCWLDLHSADNMVVISQPEVATTAVAEYIVYFCTSATIT